MLAKYIGCELVIFHVFCNNGYLKWQIEVYSSGPLRTRGPFSEIKSEKDPFTETDSQKCCPIQKCMGNFYARSIKHADRGLHE